MAKFFVTHSWNDVAFATRLCDDMRANGLDGFLDAYSIKPGDKIPKEIQTGLAACDVYLPILSRAAFKSDWCDEEINAALMLSNTPGRKGRPRIISILIEDCRADMERYALLLQRLYIDFTKDYDAAFDQLLKGLGVTRQPLPAPPSTDSLPPPPPAARPVSPRSTPETAPTPRAPVLSRDELIHLYQEARALQTEGDLRGAVARLTQIVNSTPDYRDAQSRFQKLQLYLQADDLMQKSLTDQDDRVEPWEQARACLEELLKLDPQFLDTPAKLQTAQHWIALSEIYERLLDALEADDWATAWRLFGQIRSVKPNYKRTQTLFERAWQQMVQARATKQIGKDGKEMLLVPVGEFVMGEQGVNNAPPHKVYLDAFYIDRYPVTNAEYKKFVDATKHAVPQHWTNGQIPSGKETHPVVLVSWDDANAYAQWAGKRLPTEAEWEKAASWDEIKKQKRRYPWGDSFDASKCNASESGVGDTSPVGKYSPIGDSPYGIADMAGNVWEWCADWFDENYYQNSPAQNPTGPASGQYRVLHGGSFAHDQNWVRAASRCWYDITNRDVDFGFRCASSAS